MEQIAVHVLNGVSYGMLLFIIASGLSLSIGVMGILNLAHGSLYLLGAFIGLELAKHVGSFWLVVILSGLAVGLVGLVFERIFFSRLSQKLNEQALLTLGLVYILGNLFLWIWGPIQKIGACPSYLATSINFGRLSFPIYRLALVFIGLAIFAGLWWFQNKTRAGAIVRAGMDDKEMTMMLGIDYGVFCSAIFFLGAFMGGIAGYIATPWLGAEFRMGFPMLLSAMIVVVIGGLGTVVGTLLGAVIVGLVDSLGKGFIPEYALFTPYVVFAIILLVRPYGLLGRKQ